jgi:hypothetical protein
MAEPEVDKNYLAGVGRRLDALIESVETEDYDPERDRVIVFSDHHAAPATSASVSTPTPAHSAGTTRSATARAVQPVPASTRVPSGNDPLWTKEQEPGLILRPGRTAGAATSRAARRSAP